MKVVAVNSVLLVLVLLLIPGSGLAQQGGSNSGGGPAHSGTNPSDPGGATGTSGDPGGATGTSGSWSGSSMSAATSATTTTTKHHASHNPAVHGSVASADAAAKSFLVHPKKGSDVTVKVNDKTRYTPKGKGWDDVKQGENVSVTYHNDGTDNWAVTVHFPAAKASKAPKTTATTGR